MKHMHFCRIIVCVGGELTLSANGRGHMARTTMEFTDAASLALDALSSQLGVSKTEVLRNALSLYSFLVGELGAGNRKLAIVSGTDNTLEHLVAVPGLIQAVKSVPSTTARA
jgi:hypothetical protein